MWDINCTVVNFECDYEGKSLYDSEAYYASIDFLLHIITNPKSKKAQQSREMAEVKCGHI